MSKIGSKTIEIPEGVELRINQDRVVVKGPKGELSLNLGSQVKVELKEMHLNVIGKSDDRTARSFHGLMRAQLANMVRGVFEGYEKVLEISGVGYKAQMQGSDLTLNLGFSHPVNFKIPKGIEVKLEKPTIIKIKGINKQQVGEIAARIRGLKPPEPYKGKGIRYQEEQVRRKEGKKGGK